MGDLLFSVGVDLGQRQDFTALAVAERVETTVYGFDHLHWISDAPARVEVWVVLQLERMALGTPYTVVPAGVDGYAEYAGG